MANGTSNIIWLEVANVRIFGNQAQIQVKGDRAEREPDWWNVNSSAHSDFKDPLKAYNTLSEGLEKKRIVLAGLASNGTAIECQSIRIQYTDSATR